MRIFTAIETHLPFENGAARKGIWIADKTQHRIFFLDFDNVEGGYQLIGTDSSLGT